MLLWHVARVTNATRACHCPYTNIIASLHLLIDAIVYKEMAAELAEPEIESEESIFLISLVFMLASAAYHFLPLGNSCWWQKSEEFLHVLTVIIYILHISFKLLKSAWYWSDLSISKVFVSLNNFLSPVYTPLLSFITWNDVCRNPGFFLPLQSRCTLRLRLQCA